MMVICYMKTFTSNKNIRQFLTLRVTPPAHPQPDFSEKNVATSRPNRSQVGPRGAKMKVKRGKDAVRSQDGEKIEIKRLPSKEDKST